MLNLLHSSVKSRICLMTISKSRIRNLLLSKEIRSLKRIEIYLMRELSLQKTSFRVFRSSKILHLASLRGIPLPKNWRHLRVMSLEILRRNLPLKRIKRGLHNRNRRVNISDLIQIKKFTLVKSAKLTLLQKEIKARKIGMQMAIWQLTP